MVKQVGNQKTEKGVRETKKFFVGIPSATSRKSPRW